MRSALPERASARTLFQCCGSSEFRSPNGRGRENTHGGIGRRQRRLQTLPGGKHDVTCASISLILKYLRMKKHHMIRDVVVEKMLFIEIYVDTNT